jgi:hypothetical protein
MGVPNVVAAAAKQPLPANFKKSRRVKVCFIITLLSFGFELFLERRQ